jgi:hypothetical protein
MPYLQQSNPTTITLRSLQRRIARWRSTREGRARMPDPLWEEALDLAEDVGAYRAAADLGLCYSTLRRRLDSRQQEPTVPVEPPAFVEWFTQAVNGAVAECVLEVESRGGTRLRLEMKGVQPQSLAAMLRELVA